MSTRSHPRPWAEFAGLKLVQLALQPERACQAPLNLSAGGFGNGSGPGQDDLAHGDFVLVGDSFAD